METTFNDRTPQEVRSELEHARLRDMRVRLWYGDTDTGKAWPEEHDVIGYIGRSSGRIRVPIILHNRFSASGPAIIDHRIVRIDEIATRNTVYQHPTFSSGFERRWIVEDEPARLHGLSIVVKNDDMEEIARFRQFRSAQRFVAFMNGERYAK